MMGHPLEITFAYSQQEPDVWSVVMASAVQISQEQEQKASCGACFAYSRWYHESAVMTIYMMRRQGHVLAV